MDATAVVLARRVAEAATAWLDNPRDTEAFRRLVAATDRYRAHANPPLPVDVLDVAAELVVLARSGQVGELLDGTPHEVIARLRAQLQIDAPDGGNRDDRSPNIDELLGSVGTRGERR